TAIRRLHDAGAAARDDREAAPGDARTHLARSRVVGGVRLDTRGAEHRHGQPDPRQHVEAVDELAHDPEHAPGIGVDEPGIFLPLQQTLVGRAHALLGRALGRDPADTALARTAFL